MGDGAETEVIRKTQDILGKYITKPPLTNKLLAKPPFRFLHDIVNSVITETGFLEGLYTDAELSASHVKDKDSKITFLQKCLDATSLAVGEQMVARPSKIVAGHEVDKTNLWLQCLGQAIEKQVDSSTAVKQVLEGVKPTKAEKPKKTSSSNEKTDSKHKKESSRSKESKESKSSRDKDKEHGSKEKSKERSSKERSSKEPSKDRSNKERNSKDGSSKERSSKDRTSRDKDKSKDRSSRSTKDRDKKSRDDKSKSKSKDKESRDASKARSKNKENASPNKESPKGDNMNGPVVVEEQMVTQEKRTKSARPGSARPGHRSVAEDAGIGSAGPASLLTLKDPTKEDEGNLEQPPADFDAIIVDNNNIDPAILKAMAPHENDPGHQQEGHNREGPDSGVGSLESPKHIDPDPPNLDADDNADAVPPIADPEPVLDPSPNLAPPTVPAPEVSPRNSARGPRQSARGPGHSGRGPTPLKAVGPIGQPALPPESGPTPIPPSGGDVDIRPATGRGKRPRTGLRSARPPSARPAPPRVRERREIPQEEQPRPGTSKPVANVILDQSHNDDDDDEHFVVEESQPLVEPEFNEEPVGDTQGAAAVMAAIADGADGEGDAGEAGLLVAQILETKKELEDGRRAAYSPETPGHRSVHIEQSFLSDANRRKEREQIQKDVKVLSGYIQSLTRSVNPLAKMLDYLQEDLDSMQKELDMWKDENKSLSQTLKREQGMMEQEVEPMKVQLLELETAVQDQRDRISAIKSHILRNRDRMNMMMAGINITG
ncbi:TRAF3-interacting protein 1-like isoform X4 [Oratosquilla oratoria]|uniref:TRAF3-interacting protein 1-like isoform X4 n=1 Tax=Oratosquilla oratoria TaxID=337810 RepID=UPI003F771410